MTLAKEIRNNLIVLLIVCLVAWIFLFIIGYFVTLHPDAYIDLTRSIIFVYGFYILMSIFYKVALKSRVVRNSRDKILNWQTKETPIEAICTAFTVVTAINSLMMITGYDTPKEGVFAYIHMMTRLFIISIFIIIWMWKEVKQQLETFKFKNLKFNVVLSLKSKSYVEISKTFTYVTVFYCIGMLMFYRLFSFVGGIFFYQSLLTILGIVTMFVVHKYQCSKGYE